MRRPPSFSRHCCSQTAFLGGRCIPLRLIGWPKRPGWPLLALQPQLCPPTIHLLASPPSRPAVMSAPMLPARPTDLRLLAAAKTGDAVEAAALLAAGARPTCRDPSSGRTPLHEVCSGYGSVLPRQACHLHGLTRQLAYTHKPLGRQGPASSCDPPCSKSCRQPPGAMRRWWTCCCRPAPQVRATKPTTDARLLPAHMRHADCRFFGPWQSCAHLSLPFRHPCSQRPGQGPTEPAHDGSAAQQGAGDACPPGGRR